MSCVINKYWHNTYECDENHGLAIRIYLSGIMIIICVNLILLVMIINRSAKGGITDTQQRWLVAPLLTIKILLILPETILNIFATIWAFCGSIECDNRDFYTKVVIESKFN
jgi:sn1-specific diacylglycerol lipase